MKKIIFLTIAICFAFQAAAAQTSVSGIDATLSALWLTALATAVIHTIAGPDHYLPFIAIAKSRNYSLKKNAFMDFCLRHRPYRQCLADSSGFHLFFALADQRKIRLDRNQPRKHRRLCLNRPRRCLSLMGSPSSVQTPA